MTMYNTKEDSFEKKGCCGSIYDWEGYHNSRHTPVTKLISVVSKKIPEKITNLVDFNNPDLFDSKQLHKELSALPLEMLDKFSAGLNWLHHYKIKVALIGGTAVVSYLKENRKLTPDIDFRVENQSEFINHLQEYDITFTLLLNSQNKQIGVQVPEWNMDFLFA